jgi:hypothetical protein
VVMSPLHGMVDFSGSDLLRSLCRIVFHFSLRLKEDGTIFGAVVGFDAMVLAVRRFECVGASAVTSGPIWHAASLAALHESLVGGSLMSFLQRCSKILLPIFWRPTTI